MGKHLIKMEERLTLSELKEQRNAKTPIVAAWYGGVDYYTTKDDTDNDPRLIRMTFDTSAKMRGFDTLGENGYVTSDVMYCDYYKDMAQYIDYDPNEIVLTADGNYFSSFKINGVEQAQPIQDIETKYGPVYVENKEVKYTADIQNPLRVLAPGMKLKLQRPCDELKMVLLLTNGTIFDVAQNAAGGSNIYTLFRDALQEDKQTLVLDETLALTLFESLKHLQIEFFPVYAEANQDLSELEQSLMDIYTKLGYIDYGMYIALMQEVTMGDSVIVPIDVEYSYSGYDFSPIELPLDDVCYARDIIMNLTEPLTNDTEFVSFPPSDFSDKKIGSICGIDNLPLIGLTPMDDTMMNFKINPAVFEQYNIGSIDTPCSTDFRFKNGDNYIQYKLHYSIGGVPKYVKVSTEPQVYNVTCKIADKFYVYNSPMVNPLTKTELFTTEGYSLLPYLSPTSSFPLGSSAMGKKAISPCVESIELPEGVVFIPAYYLQSAPIKQITLPSTLQAIGYMTFAECDELTSITLPNSLMVIGHQAFSLCTSLTEVVIPDSVTTIGEGAFMACTGLTSVTVGSGVTTIGEGAFRSCIGLTEIVIPNSVTNIGRYAFDTCTSLTSVTLGSGVTSINEGVFYHCSGLTEVVIPDSVTDIGNRAFSNCSSLTDIVIPNSVTSIIHSAFEYCSNLTTITCYATTAPSVNGFVFSNMPTNGVLRVPSGSDYSSWLNKLSGWTIEYI